MRAFLLVLFFAAGCFFVVADDNDLYTNTYVVPPTFLNTAGGEGALSDPFKTLRPAAPRKTAKAILMGAGISFGEGASAIYNPATSQLIVRNTQNQMELVEAYIESITQGVQKQIYVTVNEARFDEKDFRKGWKSSLYAEFQEAFELPELPKPNGKKRVVIFDSPDTFRKEFSRPPAIASNEGERVGRVINGLLTDPQYQMIIRALNQQKGVDLQNLPSAMCRSGQLLMVQEDDKRYGVQAVLGAEDFTVDLSVFIPLHGEPLFDELDAVATPHKVTIWDGQTVVIAERRENGKCRFVFVKAQIMDPAGMPIHGKVEKKKDAPGGKEPPMIAADPQASPEIQFTTAMQESVKMADEAALRGSQLMADRDYNGGIEKYEEALSLLPEHEMTVPRREAYEKQLDRAKALAKPTFADSLKSIIIPEINFRDVPLEDALGQFLVLIHEHADRGLFPDFKPRISLMDAEEIQNPRITLRLGNVPASEALRYITSLAQCKYRIEGEVIIVDPLKK